MLLVAIFMLAAVLVITTPLLLFFSPHRSKRLKGLYIAVFIFCVVLSLVTTFFYSYTPNQNTRVYGWPVPTVIFQRDGPNAPWLDFVGTTTMLAYPINLILYLCLPSILIMLLVLRRSRSHSSTEPLNQVY
jgi:hypothetical protein